MYINIRMRDVVPVSHSILFSHHFNEEPQEVVDNQMSSIPVYVRNIPGKTGASGG